MTESSSDGDELSKQEEQTKDLSDIDIRYRIIRDKSSNVIRISVREKAPRNHNRLKPFLYKANYTATGVDEAYALLRNHLHANGVKDTENLDFESSASQASADKSLSLHIEIHRNVVTDEVATEVASLCKALNAYHIACGGTGLEIDDWETLFAVRKLRAA